jgi:methyl coenzyme M reductase beta subunit
MIRLVFNIRLGVCLKRGSLGGTSPPGIEKGAFIVAVHSKTYATPSFTGA